MGFAEALAVALGAEGEGVTRWRGAGGFGCSCPSSPQHLHPQTHQLAFSNSTQCAPGVAAAAWGRGRVGQSGGGAGGPGLCGVSPHVPAPRNLPQPPTPTPGRLTGAALGVARTQPPEPRFTAITAWPLHVSPACAGGLCLGEEDSAGQRGSLPSCPQTLSPGALTAPSLA